MIDILQDFNVVMAHDGNAALTDADHSASMNAIAPTIATCLPQWRLLPKAIEGFIGRPWTRTPSTKFRNFH